MKNLPKKSPLIQRPSFLPPGIVDPEQLDVSESVVADILLRRLYMEGQSSLQSLSQSLKLAFPLVGALFQKLRQQQLFEVTGMTGNNYSFTLTTAGRELAEKRLRVNHYTGPAPVSLETYHKAVRAQQPNLRINRTLLQAALFDLVVPEELLDRLGPALVSHSSIFLHGPTGGGKTSIASRLNRVFGDVVLIPYAVEVDGQIILVYDPAVHEKAEADLEGLDARWVPCLRPCITVGGELDLTMLELRRDEVSGLYAAPPQMKANNGIFVIDDFGRQLMAPQYLLNRWIVPLDRRVDYLTLSYGVKFQIPFELMVIFATNLEPGQLADEAFLRRIRNKVHVPPVTDADFDEVFRRCLAERDLTCDPDAIRRTRELCRLASERGELRACYPSDLLNIIGSISSYEERPAAVDRESVERAVQLYFTRTSAAKPDGPPCR